MKNFSEVQKNVQDRVEEELECWQLFPFLQPLREMAGVAVVLDERVKVSTYFDGSASKTR